MQGLRDAVTLTACFNRRADSGQVDLATMVRNMLARKGQRCSPVFRFCSENWFQLLCDAVLADVAAAGHFAAQLGRGCKAVRPLYSHSAPVYSHSTLGQVALKLCKLANSDCMPGRMHSSDSLISCLAASELLTSWHDELICHRLLNYPTSSYAGMMLWR